jgi:hypothetical protein
MRKVILMFLSCCLIPDLKAESFRFSELDQAKLGILFEKMPDYYTRKRTTTIYSPVRGKKVSVSYPRNAKEYKFDCELTYYLDSPYPSLTLCLADINLEHTDVHQHYDEVKIFITNSREASALYHLIPYGKERKHLYSYGRDIGTNFQGELGNLFHYLLSCEESSCEMKFSLKNL